MNRHIYLEFQLLKKYYLVMSNGVSSCLEWIEASLWFWSDVNWSTCNEYMVNIGQNDFHIIRQCVWILINVAVISRLLFALYDAPVFSQ